jgi:NADH:ubiquinone oxidoreductase subunit 5 (subunit L)/multisubunit Na+/H+ antiporter MnhA subunit
LLAYSSVENIGIIALGLGVGLLGMSTHSPVLATLGFAGALLHVVNHALFKGLLFLGAGAVLHATGTRDIEHLGGLLKKMPVTAVTFLIGAIAISGLPPLNGFVSEFLIYLGAFKGGVTANAGAAVPLLAVIAGLALIGGLATACFTKAFSVVFLGEPRSEHAAHAHEPGPAMRWPMLLLAAGCVAIGLLSPLALGVLAPVVSVLTPGDALWEATRPLTIISGAGIVVLALIAGVALIRRQLLAGRQVGETGTWDCGYAAPTARMQYTGSSFAQPLTELFRPLLGTRRKFTPPSGYFPGPATLATDTPDVSRERAYRPAFLVVEDAMSRLRWLQHGNVQLYVLYIALTLLVLLVWKLS